MFDGFRSAMREKQRLKWEKRRKNGKWSFLVYRGVLRWGGIMFILTSITNMASRHQKLEWVTGLSLLAGCLFFGYIWGLCTWHLNEERHGYKAMR